MRQHFTLFVSGVAVGALDDNLSVMEKEEIKKRMNTYIKQFCLDLKGRYVAVGDAGDCVIYNNGNIEQVADSG